MHLRRFAVRNIRSISDASLDFERGEEAGWHVVLGSNGSGKSSLVRSFALLMMGEKEAYASRQDFSLWMRLDESDASIEGSLSMDSFWDDLTGSGPAPQRPTAVKVEFEFSKDSMGPELKFTGTGHTRTVWGTGLGWFAASFGPFRRFSGGDNKYDRMFVSNKRLATHLTALGEDVALTDAMSWLTTLSSKALYEERGSTPSKARQTLEVVTKFLNESDFLPNGASIEEVTDDEVFIRDGNDFSVLLDQLSDGYRSAMSLVLELIRQMFELYGSDKMLYSMGKSPNVIQAPGVVVIDEIDVHLHPTWQRDIGLWLTKYFPYVQFIVTTHSPIVCRAIAREDGTMRGSIWRLPTQGSEERFRKVEGLELNQLVYGDVLDAFSTELFGADVIRSSEGDRKHERLAELNIQALTSELTAEEEQERAVLRQIFPAAAGSL